MKIGFIGLGNMGGPLAANLAKAGRIVTGFDMADVAIDGITVADKLGLDRRKMFDVVSTSSGYIWTMNDYCPADNGYKPGFAAELMLKDRRLAQQSAENADADTPMGQLAQALYAQFVENEDGRGMDFSAMLPRFEKCGRDGKGYSGPR